MVAIIVCEEGYKKCSGAGDGYVKYGIKEEGVADDIMVDILRPLKMVMGP